MSEVKDNKNELSEADQQRALDELCMIFVEFQQNGDVEQFVHLIAAWKKKYPLDSFTVPNIKLKIQAILDEEYLSRYVEHWIAELVLKINEDKQEKQKKYYNELIEAFNSAGEDDVKRLAAVVKWKKKLREDGFLLNNFDNYYARQIFPLLLLPRKNLKLQAEAQDSLSKIVEQSKEMGHERLLQEVTAWQNKHVLKDFPERIQKELNKSVADLFVLIGKKNEQEHALQEIQDVISSGQVNVNPSEEIPNILSKYDYEKFDDPSKLAIAALTAKAMGLYDLAMSQINSEEPVLTSYIPPVQVNAIAILNDIVAKNNSIETLFYWIYTNRKIDFVPEAINQIKECFRKAGYPIPKGGEFKIPTLPTTVTADTLKDTMELTVLNYLGMLYTDNNNLSTISKDNIAKTYSKKEELASVAKIVIPVEDSALQESTKPLEVEKKEDTPNSDDDLMNNLDGDVVIIIDKLLNDPLETYDLVQSKSSEEAVTTNSTLEANPTADVSIDVTLDTTSDTTSDDTLNNTLDNKASSSDTSLERVTTDTVSTVTTNTVENTSSDSNPDLEPQIDSSSTISTTNTIVAVQEEDEEEEENENEIDVTTSSISLPDETLDTSNNVLTTEDQEALGKIDYAITSAMIFGLVPELSHRKKTARKTKSIPKTTYGIQEKNNGF